MINKIYTIDFFGRSLMFEQKDSNKFHTNIGLAMSILIILASLGFAYMFGRDIYQRKLPYAYDIEENLNVNKTDIPLKNFPMSLAVTVHGGRILDIDEINSLFDFDITIYYLNYMAVIYDEDIIKGFTLCSEGAAETFKDAEKPYKETLLTFFQCIILKSQYALCLTPVGSKKMAMVII